MHILQCGDTSLTLTLPACAPGPGPTTVNLSRRNCPLIPLALLPPLPGDPTTTLRVALPDPLPRRGVWIISVLSPCGCYSLAAFVDACAPPAQPTTHLPTRNTPAPVPVVCPPAPPPAPAPAPPEPSPP